MDEDYGTDLANAQADDDYYEENNMCPVCEEQYDNDGYCACDEDSEF